jgi:hypothetical protein
MTAPNPPAPAEARTVSAVSLAGWGRYMDAGAVTYAVGEVPGRCTVYLDRAEAEAAADDLGGTYIEWSGHTGRQLTTAEYQASAEPELAPAPEFEPEMEIAL